MKLVQRIEVSNFRSIRQATLDNLGDFSAFVGLNNSGKSNFLRALNAFFTDEVEPGQPINVDRDYYRSVVRSRRKKIIRVRVSFSLPTEFRFRKGLEQVEVLLGRVFSITKEWARDEPQPRVCLNESREPVSLEDRQKILQFLSLVSFRYVPNRVLPLEIIKQEHQALRDVLIRRLGRKAGGRGDIFQIIEETSEKLIGHLTPEVHKILSDIDSVRLATPKSLAEMIFAFGYKIGQGGVELEDVVQGSGVQSLLMYRTLHLIDRDYFQKFGWRQAAVWAVEEPESSLHSSLEAHVAAFLSTIVRETGNRLQVFATTHSDLVAQYSDRGYFVRGGKAGSNATQHESAELLNIASKVGVSRWVHPILFHPLEPLLLVEGKFDEVFLSKTLPLLGKENLVRIAYIELLSAAGATGGVEELKSYVKQNAAAIKSRSKTAPVLVALDWDSAKQKVQFEKWFEPGDPFAVLVWEVTESNQSLHKRFHGLEKFHSDRIINQAITKGAEILTKNDSERDRGGGSQTRRSRTH
jgi:energy-coupling factor transporter ATP-binding protein EcfA2